MRERPVSGALHGQLHGQCRATTNALPPVAGRASVVGVLLASLLVAGCGGERPSAPLEVHDRFGYVRVVAIDTARGVVCYGNTASTGVHLSCVKVAP